MYPSRVLESEDNQDDTYYGNYREYQGGHMVSPGVGVMIPISGSISLSVSAGYRYQKLRFEYSEWNDRKVTQYVKMNRLVLRVGLSL